jgi:hypothetical protein
MIEFRSLIKSFVDDNSQSFFFPLIFLVLVVTMHLLPFNKLEDGYIEQQWLLILAGLSGEDYLVNLLNG